MAFQDYKYEGDDGDIYLIRMDTDLKAALTGNTEPTGDVTKPWHVVSRGSRREFGINPRSITASRSFGTAPDNGVKRIEIPILNPASVEGDSAPISVLDTFTYQGQTWTVAAINPETER